MGNHFNLVQIVEKVFSMCVLVFPKFLIYAHLHACPHTNNLIYRCVLLLKVCFETEGEGRGEASKRE